MTESNPSGMPMIDMVVVETDDTNGLMANQSLSNAASNKDDEDDNDNNDNS